jgi:hypothetical protein
MKNSPNLHPVFYTLDDPVFTRKMIIAYRKGNNFSLAAQTFVELAKAKLQTMTLPEVVVHRPQQISRRAVCGARELAEKCERRLCAM